MVNSWCFGKKRRRAGKGGGTHLTVTAVKNNAMNLQIHTSVVHQNLWLFVKRNIFFKISSWFNWHTLPGKINPDLSLS